MAKTETLSIRIEPQIKSQSEKLFSKLTISMSKAISLFLHQCVNDRALLFTQHIGRAEIPNAETVAAMEEGERILEEIKAGKRKPDFKTSEEFFKSLGI